MCNKGRFRCRGDAYEVRLVLLTASWGAATIHVICNWFAPCAQPKNVILGNLLGWI